MQYTVIEGNFVCLWNILLFCGINCKLLWKYVSLRGKKSFLLFMLAINIFLLKLFGIYLYRINSFPLFLKTWWALFTFGIQRFSWMFCLYHKNGCINWIVLVSSFTGCLLMSFKAWLSNIMFTYNFQRYLPSCSPSFCKPSHNEYRLQTQTDSK